MHELSIASAILDQLEVERERLTDVRFTKVALKVGALSGVDPDALSFGFESLVKDTDWDPLELEIEYVHRRQRCTKCGSEFQVEHWDTACKGCGEPETETIAGEELEIAYVEVEDEPAGCR